MILCHRPIITSSHSHVSLQLTEQQRQEALSLFPSIQRGGLGVAMCLTAYAC